MASIVRWDPFQDLVSVQRNLGRMFGDLSGWAVPRRSLEEGAMMLTPTVDVIRRGEDLVFRAELPGVKPEELDISVTQNMLTLKGERREEHETKEEDYYMKESSFGTFERMLRLPEGADVDHIKAEFANGILEVTIPRAAKTEPETHHVTVSTPQAEESTTQH